MQSAREIWRKAWCDARCWQRVKGAVDAWKPRLAGAGRREDVDRILDVMRDAECSFKMSRADFHMAMRAYHARLAPDVLLTPMWLRAVRAGVALDRIAAIADSAMRRQVRAMLAGQART